MKRTLLSAAVSLFAIAVALSATPGKQPGTAKPGFEAKSETKIEPGGKDDVYASLYPGTHLYNDPDPSSGGGLKGTITSCQGAKVYGVFALPPHDPKLCYRGALSGAGGHTFEFTGLPAAKYDLFIIIGCEVYEGITLNRYKNTLTEKDKKSIAEIVQKSEPFFSKSKIIERLSGVTGNKSGKAKAIVSMLRTAAASSVAAATLGGNYRKAYKIFYFEDVGPGYQVSRTREILTGNVYPGKENAKFSYRPYLSSIRVTDSIKDLGKLDLSVPGKEEPLPDPVDEIDPSSTVTDTSETDK